METKEGAGVDPYAPPKADLDAPAPADAVTADLATRGQRLGAKMLDGLLYLVAFTPALIHAFRTDVFGRAAATGGALSAVWWSGTSPWQIATTVMTLALVALNAFLVVTTGQTVGKRAVGIKIVLKTGAPVGFFDGVVFRGWLFGAINYIPGIGGVLALIDQLFIFRRDRRCVHDFIAGTKVIEI